MKRSTIEEHSCFRALTYTIYYWEVHSHAIIGIFASHHPI